MQDRLMHIFRLLAGHFGDLHWWPADSPFEVVIGAILTQNTAWRNVELAIANLKKAGALTPAAILAMSEAQLQELIRPAGFFRQKAQRLHLFCRSLAERPEPGLEAWLTGDLNRVREELLAQKGVGPETADSILLYAGNRPCFVVDAYTRRLLSRLGLLRGDEPYETIRALFMDSLPADTALFNEYHALIVELCKQYCRKRSPLCSACPLRPICPAAHP